ncbi:MAG: iron ABC transporter permease [Betaproteobacteria bacterium]|nr:iron ABC transporter permease [Betaproteobacteria bacterium]
MPFFTFFRGLAVCLLVAPVLAVLTAWLQWDASSAVVWQGLLDTVLPDYTRTSLFLCALVALGVVSIGAVSAAAVTLFDFPGRQTLSWLLLLPLAMPAYVVAYAYTDFLQYSGPLQNWLRLHTGWQGALWPDIRSTWGAAVVLSLSLYPYVYLLCRSALAERAPQLMEAARLLGAGLLRRIFRVALPLARPAIAAGLALAMMETLADFGVSSYFGVQTFSTGIYKAWLVMDNRVAAAQLSSVLLFFVAAVLWWEHRAQARLRFANRRGPARSNESQPLRLGGWRAALANVLCLLPVLLGFVFPVLIMGHALWVGSQQQALPWAAFGGWFWNSLRLGGISALLAAALALWLAHGLRTHPTWWRRLSTQLAGLGYAVPGVVIVVGLMLPVSWVQLHWPGSGAGYWLTSTVLGLIWAYLVRFIAVALQSVQSGYARIPVSADESARMLGSRASDIFARVHWPLLRPTVASALLLVWVDVMKELPATLVLRPFNTDTLAVMAYQLARDERLGEAALPSLALVLAGLLPVLLMAKAQQK